MATRTVTGTILKPNGAPWKGAEVRFQLVDDTFRLSPDESYPLVAIAVTTNDAGQISTTLNCGLDKAYLVTMPDRETFTIIVPCGSATTLETLRSESYGIPVPGGGTMVGPTGPAGNTGPAGGPTGPVGRAGPGVVVLTRIFSTGTTDADPGNGTLRLNNATQNAATQSFIDLLDTAGVDQTTLLDSLDDSTNTVKGHLRLEKQSDAAAYLLFTLTAVTSATGYRKLVATIVGSSAANPFANSDPLYVTFVRAGDVGPVGPQGAASTVTGPTGAPGVGDVVGPAASVDSEVALFSSTTGKLLKRATGTGYVKATSGVYSTAATIPSTDLTGLLGVLLAVDPLSAVASVTRDGVFTSSFEQYHILVVIDTMSVTGASVGLRLRAAGVTSSASYFWSRYAHLSNATSGVGAGSSTSEWMIMPSLSANDHTDAGIRVELFRPQVAVRTRFEGGFGARINTIGSGGAHLEGMHDVAAAYDGFVLLASSGTITGIAYTYGIRKA